ncbi:hypothetical protein GUJ93_ZPchr0001g32635 [Zizania palustris]|uniref:BLE2 protein n=1 Tax=Zizania palustris TaxID=103762 RepID=A0A8J5RZ52_ZIZPA|nr:hypothetical protein GUJ93_ZPchr0001g32635 [Zizania palustris]
MEHGSWRRHRTDVQVTSTTLAATQSLRAMFALFCSNRKNRCTSRVFFAKSMAMGFTFAQIAANITSFVLAVLRVCKQDYVDPADQDSSDHKSIKVSLNLFYGLVLAQCISNFLAETLFLVPDVCQVLKLSMTYQLGHSGVMTIKRYMLVTYMMCSSGSVHEAMNMDLVSFAMEMARSDSVADRLYGVRVLDRILRVDKYRELALMRLRASVDTVGNVVNMLGLKSNTQKEEDTRGHAANVVLQLCPDLLVQSFPAMLQMILSLITVDTMAGRNHQHSRNVSMEFTWLGVKILNKIMDNPENRKNVADIDGQVMSTIVDLTVINNDNRNSSIIPWSAVIEEIILEAVEVLHKLVATAGDAGRVLRCKVSDNVHVLTNISKILEHPRRQTKLLVEAIGVLACLALDETGWQEIGNSPRIFRSLVSFLVARPAVAAPIPAGRAQAEAEALVQAAAEALVVFAIDHQTIAGSILQELKPEDMQKLVDILSADPPELKTIVAKLLFILHANSDDPAHAHHKRKIDAALPVLLKSIKSEVEKLEAPVSAGEHAHNFEESRTNKQGALLESFVGLSVQIPTSIGESEFDEAIRSANLTVDMIMQKLKKILDLYKSPTTEFPGIRRVTVQLILYVLLRNSTSRFHEGFIGYEMDKAVKEVAETEAKLEMFKMFYCSVGLGKHSEPISSLVSSALAGLA